jgi:hypothetical protein
MTLTTLMRSHPHAAQGIRSRFLEMVVTFTTGYGIAVLMTRRDT